MLAKAAEVGPPQPEILAKRRFGSVRSSSATGIPQLTSLRFFAAFQVLVFHVGRMSPAWNSVPQLIQDFFLNGYEAVSFFFVLSGLVLGRSNAALSEAGWSSGDKRRFWWARFARIYPAYAFSLVVAAPVFLYGVVQTDQVQASELAISLLLVPAFLQAWVPQYALVWNMPAWSLSVEAFLYALFPAIGKFVIRKGPQWAMVLALLVVAAISELRPMLFSMGFLERDSLASVNLAHYFPPLFLPHFLLGIALSRSRLPSETVAVRVFYATLAALVALFASRASLPSWMLRDVLLVPLYGLLILSAVDSESSPATAWLTWRPLVTLGEASYALYILHVPLASWWSKIERMAGLNVMTTLSELVIFFVVCIAISWLVFRRVEIPIRTWLLSKSPVAAQGNPTLGGQVRVVD